jgi:hypothetical protein
MLSVICKCHPRTCATAVLEEVACFGNGNSPGGEGRPGGPPLGDVGSALESFLELPLRWLCRYTGHCKGACCWVFGRGAVSARLPSGLHLPMVKTATDESLALLPPTLCGIVPGCAVRAGRGLGLQESHAVKTCMVLVWWVLLGNVSLVLALNLFGWVCGIATPALTQSCLCYR